MIILKEIIKEIEQAKVDSVETCRTGDYRIGLNKAINIIYNKMAQES
jgi:hypothetical protein